MFRSTFVRLIHADETKVSGKGVDGFVWVFARMEEVVYIYADTRDGDTGAETEELKALNDRLSGMKDSVLPVGRFQSPTAPLHPRISGWLSARLTSAQRCGKLMHKGE